MTYPIDGGETLNLVAMEYGAERWEHEKWIIPADYQKVVKSFEGWGKHAQGILEVCPNTFHNGPNHAKILRSC